MAILEIDVCTSWAQKQSLSFSVIQWNPINQQQIIVFYKNLINQLKMQSHRKVWKQCNYVKNDLSRDCQSSFSQCRSTQSFRFSQVKFNKYKDQQSKSSKKFALANTSSRIKEFKLNQSLLQQSNRMKENSMIKHQPGQPLKMSVKKQVNRKLESDMKNFLNGISKIYQDMKLFAENILLIFQNIKNELQSNLLQVSTELLKLGKSALQMEKVQEIFLKGFAQIRRSIKVLPDSLTNLSNQCQQSIIQGEKQMRIEVQSPLLKFDSMPERKSGSKIVPKFNFNKGEESERPKQRDTSKDIQLHLMSNQKFKNRPSTQRQQKLRNSLFDNSIFPNTQRLDSKPKKQAIYSAKSVMNKGPSIEQINKIDDIIFQMRLILNQQN